MTNYSVKANVATIKITDIDMISAFKRSLKSLETDKAIKAKIIDVEYSAPENKGVLTDSVRGTLKFDINDKIYTYNSTIVSIRSGKSGCYNLIGLADALGIKANSGSELFRDHADEMLNKEVTLFLTIRVAQDILGNPVEYLNIFFNKEDYERNKAYEEKLAAKQAAMKNLLK